MNKVKKMPVLARLFIALWAALAATLSPGQAHEGKSALTQVLFNPRTGNIEVMHRLSLHDADHAAQKMAKVKDLIGDKSAQKSLAALVRAQFALAIVGGSNEQSPAALVFTPVGHEIEGPFFWVYAEAPMPKKLGASFKLLIQNEIFRDLWADQLNLVTVEHGAFRGSATFDGSMRAKSLNVIVKAVP